MRELCNRFLAFKKKQLKSGELKKKDWKGYHDTCGKVIKAFGRGAKVASLRPEDFEALRDSLWIGKAVVRRAPRSVEGDIVRIQAIFNYAEGNRLIPGRGWIMVNPLTNQKLRPYGRPR